jgi:NADH:ubiquinone oxidoreductase subunit 3 (subunit A)
MTMKLKLLFIVMDLLTILAYPIVFVYGKLRRFSKLKESVALDNLPVTTGR